ncbi:hypothetical protein [uncultured Flavobacterium sp.]|uniref:hypothetical protein n=1 Tax=uncultured Flavobacterium sp. TaxID=165435 RepID=UPI0030ECA401|tara:strand:- start:114 stop:443 length:330 start_codon:yes stop_codon:yes gene_type:complete
MENLEDINKGKNTAIISYLTIIGTIIAVLMNNENKSEFASFHVRQALGINLLYLMLSYIIGGFDSWMISISFWVAMFALWVYGFIGALNGEKKESPIFGRFFQNIFKSL